LLLLLTYYHLYLFIIIIIIILFIYFLFLSSYSLLSQFEIFDLMLSDWVSFLAYPNLFEIKDFVVVVVVFIEVSIVRYEIRIARFGTSQKSNDTDHTCVSFAQ
jgi:hypothetical protein